MTPEEAEQEIVLFTGLIRMSLEIFRIAAARSPTSPRVSSRG